MSNESDNAQVEVERQLAIIVAQRGEHIDDAGRAEIVERLAMLRRQIDAVRGVPLTGNDEPLLRLLPRPYGEE